MPCLTLIPREVVFPAQPLLQGLGAISPSLLVARQPRMSLRGHFADNSELSPQPVNRWFRKQPAPARNRLLWLCRAFPAATVTRNLPRAPSLRCAVHVAWKEKWPGSMSALGSGWGSCQMGRAFLAGGRLEEGAKEVLCGQTVRMGPACERAPVLRDRPPKGTPGERLFIRQHLRVSASSLLFLGPGQNSR